MTRDELLARVSDVLRRSGIEDAEALVSELEKRVPPEVDWKSLERMMDFIRQLPQQQPPPPQPPPPQPLPWAWPTTTGPGEPWPIYPRAIWSDGTSPRYR